MITKEIKDSIDGIDVAKCSREVLSWLERNVEYYIDNQSRTFDVNIVLKTESASDPIFEECFKIKHLFSDYASDDNGTPNMEMEIEISNELHKKVKDIYQDINSHEDLLEKLFKRMSFFYEIKGINKGKLIMDELNGAVRISDMAYDNFTVGVESKDFQVLIDGERKTVEGSGKYTINEGFAITLEISFTASNKMDSMF